MKIAGPVLVMMLPAADERHLSACAACQPRGDIAVVVQIDGGDLAGAADLGPAGMRCALRGGILPRVSFPLPTALVLDHRSDVPEAHLKRERVLLIHTAQLV